MSTSTPIIIDPEFQSLIPPLSDLERMQLQENVERDGCREALIVWKGKGILLDGHNRFEICNRLGIEFRTEEITLKDRESARNWILKHQLGRRNLSPTDASELRGRLYNSRKKQGARTDLTSHQNDGKSRTAEAVAKETGVSKATIERDGTYAKAVDAVAEVVPDIRQKVRSGATKRKDVIAASKVAKSAPKKAAAIIAGDKSKPKASPAKNQSQPATLKFLYSLGEVGYDCIHSIYRHHVCTQSAGTVSVSDIEYGNTGPEESIFRGDGKPAVGSVNDVRFWSPAEPDFETDCNGCRFARKLSLSLWQKREAGGHYLYYEPGSVCYYDTEAMNTILAASMAAHTREQAESPTNGLG